MNFLISEYNTYYNVCDEYSSVKIQPQFNIYLTLNLHFTSKSCNIFHQGPIKIVIRTCRSLVSLTRIRNFTLNGYCRN